MKNGWNYPWNYAAFRQFFCTNYSEIFEKSMIHKGSTQFILKHNVEINSNCNNQSKE